MSADELQATIESHYSSVIDTANKRAEYIRNSGEGHPYLSDLKAISYSIKALKKLHAELTELRKHTHDWTDNEYCSICGADGRA